MKRSRRRISAYSPAELEARVAKIMAFAHPAPPEGPETGKAALHESQAPELTFAPPVTAQPSTRAVRGLSKTRWDARQLKGRAEVICVSWARISGRDVALTDAERMARLSMPLSAITKVLREVWQRKTGIGLAWKSMAEAERAFLAYEAHREKARP